MSIRAPRQRRLAPRTELARQCLQEGLDARYQDDKSLKPEDVPADDAGGAGKTILGQVPLPAKPHTSGGQELRAQLIQALLAPADSVHGALISKRAYGACRSIDGAAESTGHVLVSSALCACATLTNRPSNEVHTIFDVGVARTNPRTAGPGGQRTLPSDLPSPMTST